MVRIEESRNAADVHVDVDVDVDVVGVGDVAAVVLII